MTTLKEMKARLESINQQIEAIYDNKMLVLRSGIATRFGSHLIGAQNIITFELLDNGTLNYCEVFDLDTDEPKFCWTTEDSSGSALWGDVDDEIKAACFELIALLYARDDLEEEMECLPAEHIN